MKDKEIKQITFNKTHSILKQLAQKALITKLFILKAFSVLHSNGI